MSFLGTRSGAQGKISDSFFEIRQQGIDPGFLATFALTRVSIATLSITPPQLCSGFMSVDPIAVATLRVFEPIEPVSGAH
jgi:hypothetical protein